MLRGNRAPVQPFFSANSKLCFRLPTGFLVRNGVSFLISKVISEKMLDMSWWISIISYNFLNRNTISGRVQAAGRKNSRQSKYASRAGRHSWCWDRIRRRWLPASAKRSEGISGSLDPKQWPQRCEPAHVAPIMSPEAAPSRPHKQGRGWREPRSRLSRE